MSLDGYLGCSLRGYAGGAVGSRIGFDFLINLLFIFAPLFFFIVGIRGALDEVMNRGVLDEGVRPIPAMLDEFRICCPF